MFFHSLQTQPCHHRRLVRQKRLRLYLNLLLTAPLSEMSSHLGSRVLQKLLSKPPPSLQSRRLFLDENKWLLPWIVGCIEMAFGSTHRLLMDCTRLNRRT